MDRNAIFVGIAAGLAAALLFAAAATGGVLGAPLLMLAALPVAIAGLGWGSIAGAAAAISAALVLALLLSEIGAILFFVVIAGPMAWYAHLVGLARANDDGGIEWYPLARVLAAIALLQPTALVAAFLLVGSDIDLGTLSSSLADAVLAEAQADGQAGALPDREALGAFLDSGLRLMPPLVCGFWVAIMAADLWLAARIVRFSGRLVRPWASVADEVALPSLFILLATALILFAFTGGPAGLAASAFAGALAMAFAIVGFAVLHVGLRRTPSRKAILGAVYGLVFLFTLPLVPIAVVGAADTVLGWRARWLAGRDGTPPPLR